MQQQEIRNCIGKWTLFEKKFARATLPKFPSTPPKKNNGVIPKQDYYIPFDKESHLDTKRGGIKTYQYMHIRKINSIKNEATETLAQHLATLVCSVGTCINITIFAFEDAIGHSVLLSINALFGSFMTHAKRVCMPELHSTLLANLPSLFTIMNPFRSIVGVPKFSNIPTSTCFLSFKSTSKAEPPWPGAKRSP